MSSRWMWFMAGGSLIHGGLRLSSASHAFHTNRKGKEMSLLACKAHSCTDAWVHKNQLLSTNRDSKWQINFEAGIHCLPTGKRIKAIDPQFAVMAHASKIGNDDKRPLASRLARRRYPFFRQPHVPRSTESKRRQGSKTQLAIIVLVYLNM